MPEALNRRPSSELTTKQAQDYLNAQLDQLETIRRVTSETLYAAGRMYGEAEYTVDTTLAAIERIHVELGPQRRTEAGKVAGATREAIFQRRITQLLDTGGERLQQVVVNAGAPPPKPRHWWED